MTMDDVAVISSPAAAFEMLRSMPAAYRRSPFQWPSWQEAWWRQVGDQSALSLWGFTTSAGAPRAALITVFDRSADELRLLGDPWADYGDLTSAGELDPEEVLALLSACSHTARMLGASRVVLREISARSPLAQSAVRSGWTIAPASLCPRLSLAGGSFRRAVEISEYKRKQRRLERLGELTYRVHESAEDILPRLDPYFSMHRAQWSSRGDDALTFDSVDMRRFYRHSVHPLAADGLIQLHELRLEGKAIAFYYGYRCGMSFYAYRPAHDVAYARESPGGVLLREMLLSFSEDNIETFDFMRGDEPYKLRYADTLEQNISIELTVR